MQGLRNREGYGSGALANRRSLLAIAGRAPGLRARGKRGSQSLVDDVRMVADGLAACSAAGRVGIKRGAPGAGRAVVDHCASPPPGAVDARPASATVELAGSTEEGLTWIS